MVEENDLIEVKGNEGCVRIARLASGKGLIVHKGGGYQHLKLPSGVGSVDDLVAVCTERIERRDRKTSKEEYLFGGFQQSLPSAKCRHHRGSIRFKYQSNTFEVSVTDEGYTARIVHDKGLLFSLWVSMARLFGASVFLAQSLQYSARTPELALMGLSEKFCVPTPPFPEKMRLLGSIPDSVEEDLSYAAAILSDPKMGIRVLGEVESTPGSISFRAEGGGLGYECRVQFQPMLDCYHWSIQCDDESAAEGSSKSAGHAALHVKSGLITEVSYRSMAVPAGLLS